MNKAVFYRKTIGIKKRKQEIVESFKQGIIKCGDDFTVCDDVGDGDPNACAIILGAMPTGNRDGFIANTLKSERLRVQEKHKNVIIIESPLIGEDHYRVSLSSHLPNLGNFALGNIDGSRLHLNMKPWRKNGNHILLCLQRANAFSALDFDKYQWINKTISKIKSVTDRDIVVRPKPDDLEMNVFLDTLTGVTISRKNTLEEDLQNCWAGVAIISTVDLKIIQLGYPVFVTNERSFSWELGNTDLNNIENPSMSDTDRLALFQKVSYMQWTMEEMKQGLPWERMKNEI